MESAMAGVRSVWVVFAVFAISIAVAAPSPRLCLPQSVTEATVLVEAVGAGGCSQQTDGDFLETVDDWVFGREFRGCRITSGERRSCSISGRGVLRTKLVYRVNVTCSPAATRYTDNRQALQQRKTNLRQLQELLRRKPVIEYEYEGSAVEITFFRGRKVHYSLCDAGVYASLLGRFDICFCPASYREEVCSLPPESGRCLAYFPRYFYNSSSDQCEPFIYGGCQGNENNFETVEECLSSCRECPPGRAYSTCGSACPTSCASKDEDVSCIALCVEGCFCADGFVEHEGACVRPQECPGVCEWEPEVGPCRARIPRWFYNTTAAECQQFFYGGCHGNPNNFESTGDCQQACVGGGGEEECPGDKVFTDCGSLCPLTCENLDNPPSCAELCVEGCFCPPGTIPIDDTSDRCVPMGVCRRQGECPAGKVFKACGSGCPRNCRNKNDSIICTARCAAGCFCPDGEVELGDGCVRPEECPETDCPGMKEFRECGTACPTTCGNLGEARPCTLNCVPGCYCPPGYVERGETCVRPRDCGCPEGKEYQQCGTACPRTCENKDSVFPCTLQCVPGCYCPRGMVENDGECVDPSQCPAEVPECPQGKEYRECGTGCPKTCENKDDIVFCAAVCRPGCFCPDGMVENDGECVDPSQCPAEVPECPQGKEYQQCGTGCPKTCENKDEPVFCTAVCQPGCFCPDGMVENDGECVDPSQCPVEVPECPEGKEYQQCGTACPRTCENKDEIAFCAAVCRPGCLCPAGQVELGDSCVLPDNCPPQPAATAV